MKKSLALVLALVLCLGMLAGCGAKKEEPAAAAPAAEAPKAEAPKAEEPKAAEPAKEPEPYVYYYVRTSEEDTMCPHNGNGSNNQAIIDHVTATLFRLFPSEDGTKAELRPDLAADIPQTSDGGKTWTIKVNKDAKFANGEPITAETFVYSWKMHLDPKLFWATGSALGSGDIEIVNATAYYKQASTDKEVKWEDVGIKALDAETIEITCTKKYLPNDVMRHFRMRGSSPVYQPIYEKCINADGTSCDYGTSLEKMVCTGPYMIASYNKGTECVFEPNPYYVHRDLIHIDKVISRVVTDEATRMELFEKGENDSLTLGTNGMAKYSEDPRVRTYTSQTLYFIEVNQNNPDKPYMADPQFRWALFHGIDRKAVAKLTNNISAPYYMGTINQIPDGSLYRESEPAKALVAKYVGENDGYNPELAKKEMEEVFKKYNLTKISLNLLYYENNDNYRAASEFLQAQLPVVFGADKLEITLSSASSAVCKSTMKESVKEPCNKWDLGWFGQSLAAEVFSSYRRMECYLNSNSKAMTKYSNAVVPEIYPQMSSEEVRLDCAKTLELTAKMEESMYEDMTAIPVHAPLNYVLYSDKVNLPMKQYAYGVTYGWQYSTMNTK